jgi:hypothetical protein
MPCLHSPALEVNIKKSDPPEAKAALKEIHKSIP